MDFSLGQFIYGLFSGIVHIWTVLWNIPQMKLHPPGQFHVSFLCLRYYLSYISPMYGLPIPVSPLTLRWSLLSPQGQNAPVFFKPFLNILITYTLQKVVLTELQFGYRLCLLKQKHYIPTFVFQSILIIYIKM